jgi:hypothetical protein
MRLVMKYSPPSYSPGEAQVALPDPVIHLYWDYALGRAEEMFKEKPFPTGSAGRKPNASTSPGTGRK